MRHTASDVQARAQKLIQARGREHMDWTGLDYRLASIELWELLGIPKSKQMVGVGLPGGFFFCGHWAKPLTAKYVA